MGTLSYLKNRFYFHAKSDAERQLALKAGFQLDGQTLRWVCRNCHKAAKLRGYADGSAERKLKNYFITDLVAPEYLIYPDHLAPRTWQMESAWHILTRTPAYCADEAGLGKTITAIICINTVPGKTLVICPAFLKYNWAEEIKTWSTSKFGPVVIESRDEPEATFRNEFIICPDSLITDHKIREKLNAHKFTWVFADEFHRYKTEDAQRTKAFVGDEEDEGIASLAERVVFLSGTPIPNGRPIETYSTLSKLAPQAIGHRTFEEYGKAFCGARKVVRYEGKRAIATWDFAGASNLKQLRSELRAKLMIRHLKRDVLEELGPKTRRLIFLDQPKRFKKYEAELLENHSIEDLLGDDACLGDIASYRKEIGQAKILLIINYVTHLLRDGEKLVVFAHHVEVVEELASKLCDFGALQIRGGMTAKQKQLHVKRFQESDACRVIVGNIDAMGVGNTLTKSAHVVMAEYSFVPGVNEQAEDRCWRMTQEGHVYVDYLVYRNSLDERMLRSAMAKERNITQVMG